MPDVAPVTEISGHFASPERARAAADALNRWFRWIVEGSQAPMPRFFEPLGVEDEEYAWELREDVDWTLGPHARSLGDQVRISIQTHDTYIAVAGLLRRLGAVRTQVVRDEPPVRGA